MGVCLCRWLKPMAGGGSEVEVRVHIDRALGIEVVKRLPHGSSVVALKRVLAQDDPTGLTQPETLVLRRVVHSGEATPAEVEVVTVVGDTELLTEALTVLEVYNGASGDTPAEPAGPPSEGGLSPAAHSTAPTQNAAPSTEKTDIDILLTMAAKALRADSDFEVANAALGKLTSSLRLRTTRPKLLLVRGLLFWRWSKLGRALRDLQDARRMGAAGADLALLALQLCLSRWAEARALAKDVKQAEAVGMIDALVAAADAHSGMFMGGPCDFVPGDVEVMPGVRQSDARIRVADDVELGVRLLLQIRAGKPATDKPLILYFHGNAENVGTYADPQLFGPIHATGASALIVDFRGYGFSTGTGASIAWIHVDAERICDMLPEFISRRGLPWPWPGKLALFGRSMGSIIGCHLMAVRDDLFDGGAVLESAICGSNAPGAPPRPEPPPSGSALGGGGGGQSSEAQDELRKQTSNINEFSQELVTRAIQVALPSVPEDLPSFVHVRGPEDLIRGFDGRLLVLHGNMDTLVPEENGRRLLDAAEAATRRFVSISCKGHNDLSFSDQYVEALKKFLSGR